MSFHPRRILPPGASKKRKERESFYNPTPLPNHRATTTNPNSFVKPARADVPSAHPAQAKGKKSPEDPSPIDNRLLAGYMAHEFLTRGTILGQRFDPSVAETVEPRRKPGVAEPSQRKAKEKEMEDRSKQEHPGYADVAGMLKTDGVHIPGVVNPSQLFAWLHQR